MPDERLSQREQEIAAAYAGGETYQQIADRLFIAPSTVRTHLATIYRKLGVSSKLALHKTLDSTLPAPVLSEWPSIAVLPLEILSDAADHLFLADGISDDIITGLSRFRSLSVIARSTSFAFRDKPADMRDVARQLGVRYLFDGSLRVAGDRFRINAQLVDADNGRHLWAERFDGALEDLFAVQDDITSKIVATVAPEIEQAERQRARDAAPDSIDSWLLYQKGLSGLYESSESGLSSAIELLDQVAEADPDFGHAHAMSADARSRYCVHFVKPEDHRAMAAQAMASARKATALDGSDPLALHALARAFAMSGRHKEAVAAAREAVALNPNYGRYHQTLGYVSHIAGENQQAVESLQFALQLSPRDGYAGGFLVVLASTLLCLGRDEDALETARRGCQAADPRWWCFGIAAAAAHFLGRDGEAREAYRELYDQYPGFKVDELAAMGRSWQTQSWDRLVAGLTALGAQP